MTLSSKLNPPPCNATEGLVELIDLISSWREIHQEQKDDLDALKKRIYEPMVSIRDVDDAIDCWKIDEGTESR